MHTQHTHSSSPSLFPLTFLFFLFLEYWLLVVIVKSTSSISLINVINVLAAALLTHVGVVVAADVIVIVGLLRSAASAIASEYFAIRSFVTSSSASCSCCWCCWLMVGNVVAVVVSRTAEELPQQPTNPFNDIRHFIMISPSLCTLPDALPVNVVDQVHYLNSTARSVGLRSESL